MPRSKIDDLLVSALGTRRSQVKVQIDAYNAVPLADLQNELIELEAKLKGIDPTIATLAEEVAAAAVASPDKGL